LQHSGGFVNEATSSSVKLMFNSVKAANSEQTIDLASRLIEKKTAAATAIEVLKQSN
jgi:hypothetical protein